MDVRIQQAGNFGQPAALTRVLADNALGTSDAETARLPSFLIALARTTAHSYTTAPAARSNCDQSISRSPPADCG